MALGSFTDMIDGTMASNGGISAARPASGRQIDADFAQVISNKLCACQAMDGQMVGKSSGRGGVCP